MTYYKAFNKDFTCRNFQFSIGKTFEYKGPLKMCANGFHCCKEPLHCLSYYQRESRFCEVSVDGDNYTVDGKTVTNKMTIIREILGAELDTLLTGYVNNGMIRSWYKNGLLHSDDDKPARIWPDGSQDWYKDGEIHRDGDKPAIVAANGSQFWYKDGKCQRWWATSFYA